jgi:DNA end-binding protein Ku
VQGTDKGGDKSKPEKAAPEKAKKAEKGKKRAEGQREMLLPIAGKKKEAAKETAKPATRRKAG